IFFYSSRRRHTRFSRDWSSDVCSSDLPGRHPPFFDHLADTRIQVFAITLEREVKRHVVDPGAGVIDLLDRHADVSGKLGRRALRSEERRAGKSGDLERRRVLNIDWMRQ